MSHKNFTSIDDMLEDLEKSAPGITQEFRKRNAAREATQNIRMELRKLRKDNNMSAKDVADKIDVHEVEVLKFESGTSTILLDMAIKYAEIFGKKLSLT